MPSALAAVLFLIGVHFFLSTYNRVRLNQKRLEATTSQVQFLRENERELIRKKAVMEEVNAFLTKAKGFGLERERWVFHGVNINERMTFEQVERIMRQTSNSPAYYFKPTTLYIKKTATAADKSKVPPTPSSPGRQSAPAPSSVSLTLRGAFVVKQR